MEKIALVATRWWSGVRKWINKHPQEFWILTAILLVGAFFRLYRINDYMTFLGDEGRDAIVVRRLLVNFDPILVGPGTSIGNMYLGPLYYYMMAPALLLFNFSPVGPAVMIALLGVATIFFIWYVVKEWFTVALEGSEHSEGSEPTKLHIGALIAAFLYAISPVVITYSKSSWNPNIMPFFALLTIYGTWKVWYEQKFKWLIVVGISMAFVLQSHYLGLLLIPTIGLFWLITLFQVHKVSNTSRVRNFLRLSFFSLVFFLFLMSPLVLFDARHGWRNYAAIKTFFIQRQSTVSLKFWKGIPEIWPILRDNFITRIVTGISPTVGKYVTNILGPAVLLYLLINIKKVFNLIFKRDGANKKDENKFLSGFLLTVVWIFVGLLGMGVYKQHIYDHYFGFMFSAPFILIGAISQVVKEKLGDGIKIVFTALILLIVAMSLFHNPLKSPPNFQLKRARVIAEKIQQESGGEHFNIAVIAERNYEDGYQYFLEKNNAKYIEIDAQLPETVTDQLFVICELPKNKCDPTHNPKAEVANFGWSEIKDEWEVMGTMVYKLVHSQ